MRPIAVFLAVALLAPVSGPPLCSSKPSNSNSPAAGRRATWPATTFGAEIHHRRAFCQKRPGGGRSGNPHAGKWRLWVRSKDYPKDRPGTRNFTVRLGTQRSATVFRKTPKEDLEGWAWEDGGVLDLAAGPTLVAIGDEVTSSARCERARPFGQSRLPTRMARRGS